MKSDAKRKRGNLLMWLRSAAFGSFVLWGLLALGVSPAIGAIGLALAAAVFALFAPGIAVLVAIVSLALPILASNLLVGTIFLIISFASIQYLAQDGGRVLLLIIASLIGALYGPVWAVPVLAGYLLGASEGAVTAILACVFLEAAGLSAGTERIGLVFTGGSEALISPDEVPVDLFGFGWLSTSLDTLDPSSLLRVVSNAQPKIALLVQPLMWGAGAALSGLLSRPVPHRRPFVSAATGAMAGVTMLAVGTFFMIRFTAGESPDYLALGTAGIASLASALMVIAISEYVFPPLPVTPSIATNKQGMRAEDADVDELLRLIATAEDQLAAKHTVHSVVMLTDMKSFSKMTEEDGSVASAKTVQRHRDLLLPIIRAHGGNGKSTGGDGIVAAFPSATDAIEAAIQIQTALAEHNASHPGEREIVVRIGIADGEVVLDSGGRPFIGAALNLAARVMNLADGGQVFTTRQITDKAKHPGARLASHGIHNLKNIATQTEVVEILWDRNQVQSASEHIVPE